jgi:UrcA family protein
MTMRYLSLAAAAGLAAAAALAGAAPALAQNVDQVTVTAPTAPPDDLDVITSTAHDLRTRPQSISETVSLAGLDLNSPHDRQVLLSRVNVTAGRICDQLNEDPPSAGNLGHSCQEVAVRDAMGQVHQAFADARTPATAGAYAEAASAQVSDTTANGN